MKVYFLVRTSFFLKLLYEKLTHAVKKSSISIVVSGKVSDKKVHIFATASKKERMDVMQLTKGAIGNLINRYKAVLKKCHLMNVFGSLAVAAMLVMAGAGGPAAAGFTFPLYPSDAADKEPGVKTGGR